MAGLVNRAVSTGVFNKEFAFTGMDAARPNLERSGDDMKLVMAIIKPFKLDEVREALTGLGIQGPTFTNEVQHRYAAELRWESIMDSSILTSG